MAAIGSPETAHNIFTASLDKTVAVWEPIGYMLVEDEEMPSESCDCSCEECNEI